MSTLPEPLFEPQPVLGYGRQLIDEDDKDAVMQVLSGEWLTQGPAVLEFESTLCRATGAAHAVAVSNGTAALWAAARSLDIGPGDLVWTTANTFLATATTALSCGARVEFLDIERKSANLDLDILEERLETGPTPRAVTIVHFAGLPLNMERLLELKQRFGFLVIEDAAHALGAGYHAAGRTWRIGENPAIDATCLSFHPVKHVTTGEGGAVLVHDGKRAERLRALRSHGVNRTSTERPFDWISGEVQDPAGPPDWFAPMLELGGNVRLSDLAAALGTSQLGKLSAFVERRRALAGRYRQSLAERDGIELLDAGDLARTHAWHLFCVRVAPEKRDAVMASLRQQGVGTQLHYYPVPYQPWFRSRFGETSFPEAERHARRSLSLPLFPGMRDEDVDRVTAALAAALDG